MKKRWFVVPYILLAACSSSSGPNETLTSVGDASSTACPNGGVTITSGVDNNNNGVLDSSEVTTTKNICDGATPVASSLVTTTSLPNGDPNCANGGTEIDTGLDNGAGGGTAGDGILQAGEVTNRQYVCNGGGIPLFIGSTTPPASPTGQFTIDTSGGDAQGSNSTAGPAGNINLFMEHGTLGGALKVFATGSADASFTIPTIAFYGGTNSVEVKMDTPVPVYATPDGVADNDTIFELIGDSNLYLNTGGTPTIVTGLDIDAGVTVTFSSNNDGETQLEFSNDLRNAGNIFTSLEEGGGADSLTITLNSYFGSVGSTIDTSGADGSSTVGGGRAGAIQFNFSGTIVNQGDLTATGGAGSFGGNGGPVTWAPANSAAVFNTGTIDTHGGDGTGSSAGPAGDIDLEATYGDVNNAGKLFAFGGSGRSGGTGGAITLETRVGAVRNSGDLDYSGGGCTGSNCQAADARAITLSSNGGGDVINAATLTANGGSTADNTGTQGGSGGSVSITACDCKSNYRGGSGLRAGSINVSGTISTTGGTGRNGGGGGKLNIDLNVASSAHGQELILFGYTQITANGGSAMSTGATAQDGGQITFSQNDTAYSPEEDEGVGPAGAVINYANVTALGGDGAAPGSAGNISFSTEPYDFRDSFEVALNFGAIDVSGGSASENDASRGGNVDLFGVSGAANNGAVTATGGVSTNEGGDCGNGGNISIYASTGPATNTGIIHASGASNTVAGSFGGNGGTVDIAGSLASNTAAITCEGGDGGTGGNGGGGGEIELRSSPDGTSTNSGTLLVSPGTNPFNGSFAGEIRIDGQLVAS